MHVAMVYAKDNVQETDVLNFREDRFGLTLAVILFEEDFFDEDFDVLGKRRDKNKITGFFSG